MLEIYVKEPCTCDDCGDEAEFWQLTWRGWKNLCARDQAVYGDSDTTERLIVTEYDDTGDLELVGVEGFSFE